MREKGFTRINFAKQNLSGFTLAEAVIALGIASVVGTLLLVIITNSAGLFYKQSSKIEQGVRINDALAQIRESIKTSQSVADSYQSGQTTYTSSLTSLILKVPSIDTSGSIISNIYDYFIFFQDQTKLRFKSFPDSSSSRKSADQILSTNIDSLQFIYLNKANPPAEVSPASSSKIKITLSLEKDVATSEAHLRND